MNAILGQIEPDKVSEILGTGFSRFTSPTGCHGLFKERNSELVILAVAATIPGTGQFRAFIEQAKTQYPSIAILDVLNDWLGPVLTRYGFVRSEEFDDGELVEVYRWRM